jgi:hypothetical protein
MTRLPTERLATACWAFIVAKTTEPEPAPMLVFWPLQVANRKFYTQLINKPQTHLQTAGSAALWHWKAWKRQQFAAF